MPSLCRKEPRMKITTLVENDLADAAQGLEAEFGLSLLIEHAGKRLLFDTGAAGAAMRNAARLDVDLGRVDALVLSHHHVDHAGGLPAFFQVNAQARVFLRPPPDGQPTLRALLVVHRYIGLPEGVLQQHAHRFVFVQRQTEVMPGVFILTELPHLHPLPRGDRLLYLKGEHGYVRDPFLHELVMVLREPDGLAVFTGCGHSGVLNMVEAVMRAFPDQPIKAVVGGFHLIGLPGLNTMAGTHDEMRELGQAMRALPVAAWWTAHCTGHKAYDVLKQALGERLHEFHTGTSLTL
jgi:7,8-dihydropterin-6-yl-methyl-4-(beta-D-ribofuranosyl)aminobenzene 5'-phosphate synthase